MPAIVEQTQPSLAHTLLKGLKDTAVDPTTYAPGITNYITAKSDWNTSQPLFAKGYVEQNPNYTQSGVSGSAPIGYEEGMGKIKGEAIRNLLTQSGNNVLANVLMQRLAEKYPDHKKLINGLGWAEKIAVSGLGSYLGSVNHITQTKKNKDMLAGQP